MQTRELQYPRNSNDPELEVSVDYHGNILSAFLFASLCDGTEIGHIDVTEQVKANPALVKLIDEDWSQIDWTEKADDDDWALESLREIFKP